ncbi:MAG: hypothetical protein JO263_07940 [Candidatus Eremiobacteraeota bacterium]|nr:hypothetical protein [Candidatus Eremiobacteraeota bacterium]
MNRWFATSAVVLLLSACAGNASEPFRGSAPPLAPDGAAARQRLVYITDATSSNAGFIDVFRMDGTKIRSITQGLYAPAGLFVDAGRHLWVANSLGGNILEFSKGAGSLLKTLDDSGGVPIDVTLCPNGTVYVSNYDSPNSNVGSIAVYAHGSTTSTRTLTWPGEFHSLFVTCDAAGNVYQSLIYTRSSGPGVFVVFPHGKQSHAKQLTSIVSQFPGGMRPDAAGNLLVVDQIAQTITEYTTAGKPTGLSIGTSNITNIDVTHNGATVGGADNVDKEGKAWTWPGGTLSRTYDDPKFTLFGPRGFAFDPNIASP